MAARRAAGALLGLCLALVAAAVFAAPRPAEAAARHPRTVVFEVCKHGCRYRTIQRAVYAAMLVAGSAPRKAHAVVSVGPGRYAEAVVAQGTGRGRQLESLTIQGSKPNARRVVLDGRGAGAQSGIEAVGVAGLKIRNIWVRRFGGSGIVVRFGHGRACGGYRLENVLVSGNRGDGVEARGCPGGRISGSAAWGQGEAGFHVAEEKRRTWTVLEDDRAWENAIGYSGTNSRYVKVLESAFFDNGLGLAVATLDAEALEPAGRHVIERDDVFWNDYDHFLARAHFPTAMPTLGSLGGTPIAYPIGVGVLLYGVDHATVRHNDVFGHYKWGVATLSAPGEPFGPGGSRLANAGDDAKSLDNEIVENRMGREGADPNGEFDFFADATGGGSCWGGNSPGARFAPGNGRVPLARIYPDCPQAEVDPAEVSSLDTSAGLQVNGADESDPRTAIGYLTTSPPQRQECSWVRRGPHPAFQSFSPVEPPAAPGEIAC